MPTKIKTLGSRKHQIIYESTKGLNSEIKNNFSYLGVSWVNDSYTILFLNHQISF